MQKHGRAEYPNRCHPHPGSRERTSVAEGQRASGRFRHFAPTLTVRIQQSTPVSR
jgi:hypothetical protein